MRPQNGVGLLFGPILLGVLLNCMFYGATIIQMLVYLQTFKGDPRWLKTFVIYLLFCETVNTTCDIIMIYEPLVIRYGTPRAVIISPFLLPADPISTVMISLPVQLFIAWRVRVLSRSSIIPAIISFFAVASFIGGIATGILAAILNEYDRFVQFHPAPLTWLASSAIADILITTSLVHNLSSRRTGFRATDDTIDRIIRLTVHTGLITAIFALLDIVFFMGFKKATLNFFWDLSLSKLYSNTLLSTLNARGGWKASSTWRDNVLFGAGASGTEAAPRNQLEILSVNPQAGPALGMVDTKAFGSGADRRHESADTIPPELVGAV